jgi:hypothetical protein
MRLLLFLSICFGLALSLNSCKRDCDDPTNPDCSNYNPCHNAEPVEADITLLQKSGVSGQFSNLYFESDYIFPPSRINFNTSLEGAKYSWELGAETITSKQFERHFLSAPFGEYTVKLIVEKEPNRQCFPNDNGKDTVVKKFRIVPTCELESMGVFKVKQDNSSSDSSIVTIRTYRDGSYTDSCFWGITRFINLQNKQDTLIGSCILTNSELMQSDYPALGFRKFHLKINPKDKSTTIEFYISEKQFILRGRKIAD